MSATLTAHERRRYAIVKARERRAVVLAPVLAEINRLVAEVGWPQARPVAAAVMAPVRVAGPAACGAAGSASMPVGASSRD